MKRVVVRNTAGVQTHGAEMVDPSSWIESCVSSNAWGLPERWTLHKSEAGAKPYPDSEVILDEIRPDSDGTQHRWVKLRSQYTVEILDITAQVAQAEINAEAEEYLASTDWLIIRQVDSGVPCPLEIKALREQARARIVR